MSNKGALRRGILQGSEMRTKRLPGAEGRGCNFSVKTDDLAEVKYV